MNRSIRFPKRRQGYLPGQKTSFPEYVKIGYAAKLEERLRQLNRSEAIPYAFRAYATYEVESNLTDVVFHDLIDRLNPDLRSIETFAGRERKREVEQKPD